ncbi:hypothetical protein [Phenylobacterium sp.]|uniref:hypothetical protein n=1 Tax=Phenylobacterium sp. TaxID=1871053 RepID=UPI002E3640B1|nr:hypothetical protein [Phenylobacterium sp.]HEX4712981.1 hypothetical protein [Phenylobacterium sp.]
MQAPDQLAELKREAICGVGETGEVVGEDQAAVRSAVQYSRQGRIFRHVHLNSALAGDEGEAATLASGKGQFDDILAPGPGVAADGNAPGKADAALTQGGLNGGADGALWPDHMGLACVAWAADRWDQGEGIAAPKLARDD